MAATLDLHGCTSDEVVDQVDNFICQQVQRGVSRTRIMTGKGKGIVKKAVIQYLKKAHYPWEYEKLKNGQRNEGVLIVILD